MKYKEFLDLMEEIAPTEAYRDIDNSGPQIYSGSQDIDRILVCLEMNMSVLMEAADVNADLILTHHPLIYTPQSVIDYNDLPGRYIHWSINLGMSVYSSHLAFDFAKDGNNAYLAKLLGLVDVEPGSAEKEWIGTLPEPMTFEQACRHVEQALDLPENYIRCVDGGRPEISKVGLCTGAGGGFIEDAAKSGCDLYITGDLKLHEAQYAKALRLCVIDAGHYGTEKIFSENMAEQINAKAKEKGLDIDVIIAKANTNPYTL